jgi:hypothetical protein
VVIRIEADHTNRDIEQSDSYLTSGTITDGSHYNKSQLDQRASGSMAFFQSHTTTCNQTCGEIGLAKFYGDRNFASIFALE